MVAAVLLMIGVGLDLPALDSRLGGRLFPQGPVRVGGPLLTGPRRERRPEDDGIIVALLVAAGSLAPDTEPLAGRPADAVDYPRSACRDGDRNRPGAGGSCARWGCGSRSSNRTAASAQKQAEPSRSSSPPTWDPRIDHTHDHWRHRRSGLDARRIGGQMGDSGSDRLGVDSDDPRRRPSWPLPPTCHNAFHAR